MNAAESIKYITPELIILVFSLATLILGLFVKKANVLGIFSLIGIAIAGFSLANCSVSGLPIFSNLLLDDSFAKFFRELLLIISGIVILISMGYRALGDEDAGEYYCLLLMVTVAMMLAVSSNNLLMIYVALEMVSLISYILVGFLKRDNLSAEGALKYFLFGALSTGIMLYGISFIYGLFGTTSLSVMPAAVADANTNNFVAVTALILVLAGFAFKCGLVPFHMWIPDAYQGAPTSITAFISVAPKAMGFALLVRVFLKNFFPLFSGWVDLTSLICLFTMTAGNVMALSQNNIKRMLGYSSIAQAGYILIGFVVGTSLGIKAVLFYILAYALMNLGAFVCVVIVSNSIKSDSIEDYSGLSKKDPAAAAILSIFLLSLSGIPPLAGFLGKFFVLAAAVEERFVFIVIAAVINSVIALYYYVRVIKYMYLDEPKMEFMRQRSFPLQIALIITLLGVLIAGLYPYPFLNWISYASF